MHTEFGQPHPVDWGPRLKSFSTEKELSMIMLHCLPPLPLVCFLETGFLSLSLAVLKHNL